MCGVCRFGYMLRMACNVCFSGEEGVSVVLWAKVYRGDEEFLIHVFLRHVKFSQSI